MSLISNISRVSNTTHSVIRFPSDSSNQPSVIIHITKNNIEMAEISNSTSNTVSGVKGQLSNAIEQARTGLQNLGNTLTSALGANIKSTDIFTLALPMPVDINVSYNAEWNGTSLSPLEYALREVIQGNFSQESIDKAERLYTQRTAVGLIKNVVGRTKIGSAGKVVGFSFNPYRELIYDSPSFRTFSFDWVLSPKNQQESDNIRKIVFILKKHMHPSVAGSGAEDSLLFLYPELCTIEFWDGNEAQNTYLFKMDECAITNLSVFYDNKFHQGSNAPTQVSIKLSLMETKILTQSDFGDDKTSLTY